MVWVGGICMVCMYVGNLYLTIGPRNVLPGILTIGEYFARKSLLFIKGLPFRIFFLANLTSISNFGLFSYRFIHPPIQAYMHTYMHTCIHPSINQLINPSIHTSIHPYIHIHPCIHAFIYMYI